VGGNTSCIELRLANTNIIIDMGSGAKNLGEAILSTPLSERNTHYFILLSHYHWDHIIGMPFFRPFYNSQFEFDLYGPSINGLTKPGESIEHLMKAPYFPITSELFNAKIRDHIVHEDDSFVLGTSNIDVTPIPLNHAPGTIGYCLSDGDTRVVYASDMEHTANGFDEHLIKCCSEANVLIYDAMYTNEQYYSNTDSKIGWGHSTWEKACELATLSQVGHLFLFHHNPLHSDMEMANILASAQSHFPSVSLAVEGESLVL
jgi:phosphoribosyl 1,2-cyclic phosphodiesterase